MQTTISMEAALARLVELRRWDKNLAEQALRGAAPDHGLCQNWVGNDQGLEGTHCWPAEVAVEDCLHQVAAAVAARRWRDAAHLVQRTMVAPCGEGLGTWQGPIPVITSAGGRAIYGWHVQVRYKGGAIHGPDGLMQIDGFFCPGQYAKAEEVAGSIRETGVFDAVSVEYCWRGMS